jgi:hypothetical protein
MAAREKPGTSMVETIFSARMHPLARERGTLVMRARGGWSKTMDRASSREMRLRNSLGMVGTFCGCL